MDSVSVVAIIALLCFFFFFFFFFLLGGVGVYFFIVKKKDTSEEKTSAMTSQTRFPLVPYVPHVPHVPLSPIVSPLLKKSEPFDISENNLFKERLVRLEDTVSGLQKEKELRDMKSLEEKKALKERIETEYNEISDSMKYQYTVNQRLHGDL